MNPWYVLKIEKTEDKNAVREAYMALLPKYNPEEDPTGFANLRSAYEEALKEIDQQADASINANDPVSILFQELAAIYQDFAKRIDPSQWEEALKSDVCTALDTEEEVDLKMLEFISQHHNMPTSVWVVLDNRFRWREREAELLEKYGPGLINSIIGSVDNKFDMHYELFDYDLGADIDRYIFQRNALTTAIDNRNKEEADPLVEEIKTLGVRHPGFDIEMARYLALDGNSDEALEAINAVLAKHPVYENEPFAVYVKASILLSFEDKEKQEEALATYKKALEIVPNYFFAKLGVVDTLVKKEEYDDAEKYLTDELLLENPSQEYLHHYYHHISGLKLKKYEELHAENPTQETAEKLAQCYAQSNQHDKCIELLQDKERTAKSCDLLGYSHMRKKDYTTAIKFVEESIEKEAKYRGYLLLTEIYLAMRNYDKAIEVAEKGLSAGLPEEGTDILGKARLQSDMAYAHKKLENLDKALEIINEAIVLNDKMTNLYADKADILLDMFNLSEAFAEAEKSMNLMPSWSRPYELMADIFYRAGNYEEMANVFEQTDKSEIKSNGLTYFKGCMAGAQEKYDECNEILGNLLKEENLDIWEDKILDALCFYNRKSENHEQVVHYAEKLINYLKTNNFPPNAKAYMYLASAHNEMHGPDKELDTLIQGLKAIPDSEQLLLQYDFAYDSDESSKQYSAWRRIIEAAPKNVVPYNRLAILYGQEDKYQEALDILAQGLAAQPGNINLIGRRGYILSDMGEYEKAIADYLQVADNPQDQDTWWEKGYMYFEAGWLYWSKLNNADAAEKYMLLADEHDGLEGTWEKGFLGDIYKHTHDYDKAIKVYSECIEEDEEDEYAYLTRGETYKLAGQLENAKADFEKVLELVTSDEEDASHDSYRFAGTAYLELDNPKKAKEYYKKAEKTVKTDGTKDGECFCIYQSWAKYHMYNKDYKKALKQIELAIGLSNSVRNNAQKQEILQNL